MDIDYIKPSKEKRRDFTFTKAERKVFIDKLASLGIPILLWVSKDKSFLSNKRQYNLESVLDWLVTTIIDQGKKIEELEKIVNG